MYKTKLMDGFQNARKNLNNIRSILPPKKKGENKYIGLPINFTKIRDFIVDSKITEEDIILLNSRNFYDLMEEYRVMYKTSMPIPYKFLGVILEEDSTVPEDRISVIKDDSQNSF